MEKKKNVPVLRFPEFSGEWEKKKLGDIVELKSEKFNPNNHNTSVKCIELEHLASETGQLLGFIDGQYSGSIKNKFSKGEILFGKLRPYLKKYLIAPFDGVCSSEIWVLTGTKITNDFLYYIVNTDKFIELANISSGSKMPRADWNVVNSGIFNITTSPEQQKITSFLKPIDDKLQALKKKKTLLEQYKKGMMQKIFLQELRFKDDNGAPFPKWEKKKLNNLVKIMYGKDQKKVSDENGKYPILGTGGIIGRTNQFLCDKPSVLIGRKGTIDKPVYMDTPFWTVDTLFYTEVFSNTLPKWLYFKFQTINWYLFNEASGVPSLSGSTIYTIKILLPCLEEQTKIANFLSAIDDKINLCNVQIEKTEQWKKGLLQKMFV